MRSLLPVSCNEQNDEHDKAAKKSPLTIYQWLEAWEVFIAIFTSKKRNRKHIQSLLTYITVTFRTCQSLARIGRATTNSSGWIEPLKKCSWATVRYDLRLMFGQPHQSNTRPIQPFKDAKIFMHPATRSHPIFKPKTAPCTQPKATPSLEASASVSTVEARSVKEVQSAHIFTDAPTVAGATLSLKGVTPIVSDSTTALTKAP